MNLEENKPIVLPEKNIVVKLPQSKVIKMPGTKDIPPPVKLNDLRKANEGAVDPSEILKRLQQHRVSKVAVAQPIALPIVEETAQPAPQKAVKISDKPVTLQEGVEEEEAAAVAMPELEQQPIGETELKERTERKDRTERKERKKKEKEVVALPVAIGEPSFESAAMMNLPKVQIGDTSFQDRLKQTKPTIMKVPSYYMNNRAIFVKFINDLFERTYGEQLAREDTGSITCATIGRNAKDMDLFTHQKIVRDYLNLYTPYRGLLLFHGLGSGKTCTSIAIAEGMKSMNKVIVMTPASLRRNYLDELKKCGDYIYKRQQFWEWIHADANSPIANTLSQVLSLPINNINENHGAWLVNVSKPSNYETLTLPEQKSLNAQIDLMIAQKYQFINYNGLRRGSVETLTNNHTFNLFDNSTVIIDEAHNFISRIVNKINKEYKNKYNSKGQFVGEPNPEYYLFPKKGKNKQGQEEKEEKEEDRNMSEPKPRYKYVSLALYDYLLNAKNVRIVLLTGTPIINYPNEIGILYNILRGYIKTFSFPITVNSQKSISEDSLKEIFYNEKILDQLEYSPRVGTLTVTRNPFGFKSKISKNQGYKGVTNEPEENKEGAIILPGQRTDAQFIEDIKYTLRKHDVDVNLTNVKVEYYKALPDKLYDFAEMFMEHGTDTKNLDEFKRRIVGLTSYFRSAQEGLMPRYDPNFEPIYVEMSDYQFNMYEEMRVEEIKKEKNDKKTQKRQQSVVGEIYDEPSSTFKIFSRMFCNFAMPTPPGRPNPIEKQGELAYYENVDGRFVLVRGFGDNKEYDYSDTMALGEQVSEKRKQEVKTYKAKKALALRKTRKAKKLSKINEAGEDVDGDSSAEEGDEAVAEAEDSRLGKMLDHVDKRRDAKTAADEMGDELEGDELLEDFLQPSYKEKVELAFQFLKDHKMQLLSKHGLAIYSPKFLQMIEKITDSQNIGLHLVYSQFRTLEGIGIFALSLEANGFARFKIRRNALSWDIDMSEDDWAKPHYALYTGTESDEEKDIIRHIYNSDWHLIPDVIATKLRAKNHNNNVGEIIKVLMITASGSEGINLRNTRFVHIMEPYWNPVRAEQVIGRARRICSHQALPIELQTVEVFMYIMRLSQSQLDRASIILKNFDVSKINKHIVFTSEQTLHEISTIKKNVTNQITRAIKETSIDCAIHAKGHSQEGFKCVSFGEAVSPQVFAYNPDIEKDDKGSISDFVKTTRAHEQRKEEWVGQDIVLGTETYIRRMDNNFIYDKKSYMDAQSDVTGNLVPKLVGKLVENREGKFKFERVK